MDTQDSTEQRFLTDEIILHVTILYTSQCWFFFFFCNSSSHLLQIPPLLPSEQLLLFFPSQRFSFSLSSIPRAQIHCPQEFEKLQVDHKEHLSYPNPTFRKSGIRSCECSRSCEMGNEGAVEVSTDMNKALYNPAHYGANVNDPNQCYRNILVFTFQVYQIAIFNLLFSFVIPYIEAIYHILRSDRRECSCNIQKLRPSKFLNQCFMPRGTFWAEDNK